MSSLRPPDQELGWLVPEDVERLRTACHEAAFRSALRRRNDALIAVLYDTGRPAEEVTGLDVAAFDFEDGRLSCPGAERIDLDPARSIGTVRALRSYLEDRTANGSEPLFPAMDGGGLSTPGVRNLVEKAAAVAGVRPYSPGEKEPTTDVTPQTVRHATAWRLLNVENWSFEAVRDRMGLDVTPDETVERYLTSLDGDDEGGTGGRHPGSRGDPGGSGGGRTDRTEGESIGNLLGGAVTDTDVLDAVREVVYVFDTTGRMVWWNDRASEVTEYTDDEIAERNALEFVLGDDRNRIAEVLSDVIERGQPETTESHLVTKDGDPIPYELSGAPITDDEGTVLGVAGVGRDVTERRERERKIARQRDELATLERINTVIRDVDQILVSAPDRETIEREVCDRLAAVDPYTCAWIGERGTDDGITPRAWSGLDECDLAPVRETGPSITGDPAWEAVDAAEPRIVDVSDPGPGSPPAVEVVRDRTPATSIAVPVRYRDTTYGVLVVYADRVGTFDGPQGTVLSELGETIGHAINATERKEALAADAGVELKVETGDLFHARATRQDGAVTLEGVVPRPPQGYVEYLSVTGGDHERVVESVEDAGDVDHVRVLDRHEDGCLCEVEVEGPSVASAVAEHGGALREITAENGSATLVVEFPAFADVHRVVEGLRNVTPDADLIAKRSLDPPIQTDHQFRTEVTDRLTDKQLVALRTAYFAGFFERPRLSTGEEIAERLDVSPSTFHQHLRVGLRKLLATTLDHSSGED